MKGLQTHCQQLISSVEAGLTALQKHGNCLVQWVLIARECLAGVFLIVTKEAVASLHSLGILLEGRMAAFQHESKTPIDPFFEAISDKKETWGSLRSDQFPTKLALVKSNTLNIFDTVNLEWGSYPLAAHIDVNETTRYLWAGHDLFLSGGKCKLGRGMNRNCKNSAYLLRGDAHWEVQQQAKMLIPRLAHGLWWHAAKSSILVFGGKW
jgi:hypothetical protein